MSKEIKEIYLAELKEYRTYALPVEHVDPETAKQIRDRVGCGIVLLPEKCFGLSLKDNEKENEN